MMYYSTNDPTHRVDGRTAVLAGLAPDGGLYMPETIPRLPEAFFDSLHEQTLQDIGFTVAQAFLGDDVPDDKMREIVVKALDFDIPLKPLRTLPLSKGELEGVAVHVLELFHGPTLAFKDVGARFMARLMGHFVQNEDGERTILVATSGDTGSAVASGFSGVPGIRVVILYPSGKVSRLQEAQMTSLGGNVIALEVDGVFDDCQKLVKQAFVDPELTNRLRLSSANSINIARLIPQTFYYFWAVAQLERTSPLSFDPPPARGSFDSELTVEEGARGGGSGEVIVSVPSGNFGNLTAGLIAKRMGLPVERFIAATNGNDVVPEYLETDVFRPRPSVATISNAMDVGNPSNFARMRELYPSVEAMREDIVGIKVSEEETRETIAHVYRDTGYTLDPHSAVAYAALVGYGQGGIFLATAHPAKFKDVVEEATGQPVVLPERLAACLSKQKTSIKLPADFETLKKFLLF